MADISLYRLYKILENIKKSEEYSEDEIKIVENLITQIELLLEDTSATGGPAGAVGSSSIGVGSIGVSMANATTAGMGPVQSSQPSSIPGALNGQSWISGGGKDGSGDISVPYNPSGANRMFQKFPAFSKKKQSDPNVITKKSRHKQLDMKTLKDMMSSKKDVTTKVTKVKEGRAYDVAKKGTKETHDISKFQDMIESHIKSLGAKVKKVGNDFEIHSILLNFNEYAHIGQVMFRKDYIGVQKTGNKFPQEFEYTQLKKVKDRITELLK